MLLILPATSTWKNYNALQGISFHATTATALHMIISLFIYLGRLQEQLVEVYQVWLDGQQNAAVDSIASLKPLSIHYTIHSKTNKEKNGLVRTFSKWSHKRDMANFPWKFF